MRTVLTLAAALSLLMAAPLGAQTASDPDHPDASAPAGATPPDGAGPGGMGPGGMGMGGMTGSGGMMGPSGGMTYGGMMGSGMMGPGMGAEGGRGGDAMPMAGMMRMMGAAGDHLDGRLAFLKAELKITDAQAPQWSAFEQAVRDNAKTMAESRQAMMATGKTLPERLATEEAAVNRHATAIGTTRAAVDKLYAALSPEQKKTADSIVIGPMGMPMGMMP